MVSFRVSLPPETWVPIVLVLLLIVIWAFTAQDRTLGDLIDFLYLGPRAGWISGVALLLFVILAVLSTRFGILKPVANFIGEWTRYQRSN